MKDVDRYNKLDEYRDLGYLLTPNEQSYLDSIDAIGGINSSYFRKLILIYIIVWMPLFLYDYIKKIKNEFIWLKNINIGNHQYFILICKLANRKFKIYYEDGQLFFDMWKIGLSIWRIKTNKNKRGE